LLRLEADGWWGGDLIGLRGLARHRREHGAVLELRLPSRQIAPSTPRPSPGSSSPLDPGKVGAVRTA
jgi:hypothetical protein